MHINRLSTSAGVLALSFSTSFAADFTPVSVPAYDWTGIYAGVNIGYAHVEAQVSDIGPIAANLDDDPLKVDYDALTLGGQVGYNHQWEYFVAGVEADIGWISGDGSSATSRFQSAPIMYSSSMSAIASVRARAGLAFDELFIYATGGLAWGRVKDRVLSTADDFLDLQNASWRNGTVWGGGLEYALGNNVSIKVEALRFDFDSVERQFTVFNGPYAFEFDEDVTTVRTGLNFNF